jgi:menaquinone-dependent protoporphyrinogen IX oxidase
MANSRILVVHYSRTGTTRKVAELLAAQLRCDGETIMEERERSGMLGYLRSVVEARRQVPSHIAAAVRDPSIYDLVVIGTPVWAWSLSSPVRAYLLANKSRLPAVAFFCTLGGAGSERAFAQMQEVAGKRPIGRLSVTAREVASATYEREAATFVQSLQRQLAAQREAAPRNVNVVTRERAPLITPTAGPDARPPH